MRLALALVFLAACSNSPQDESAQETPQSLDADVKDAPSPIAAQDAPVSDSAVDRACFGETLCELEWAGTHAYCGANPDYARCWGVQFKGRVVTCCADVRP